MFFYIPAEAMQQEASLHDNSDIIYISSTESNSRPAHSAHFHNQLTVRIQPTQISPDTFLEISSKNDDANSPSKNNTLKTMKSTFVPQHFIFTPSLENDKRRIKELPELIKDAQKIFDALQSNNPRIIKKILEEEDQKNINTEYETMKTADAVNPITGDCLLSLAAEYSSPAILMTILSKGPKLNKKNCFGQTALHRAVLCAEDTSIVQLLLRAGAAPDIQDNNNNTALNIAHHYAEGVTKHQICSQQHFVLTRKILQDHIELQEKIALEIFTHISIADRDANNTITKLIMEYRS
ncbi:MAG: ankyrin repeat domain-containing protein [Candidatus Dependentiae bacterium]|nr:ankyrin repeat domain-containing protein [Candidatus Dependentiae bacterium]